MIKNIFVIVLAFTPTIAVIHLNYRRWKDRYGPNVNIISYYLPYATSKKETDDIAIIYIAKAIFCLFWAVFITGLMIG